jgi:phosphopantetheinyl transferase
MHADAPPFFVAFSQAGKRLGVLPTWHERRAERDRVVDRLALSAAARALDGKAGAAPVASTLKVLRDERGRPQLRAADGPADVGVDVSISHSGACLAAAAVRGARIGIDLEPLAEIPSRTWRYFLTDPEQQACSGAPLRALWIWTIKEAAFKAVGGTRALHFKDVVVEGWDEGAPCVRMPHALGAAQVTLIEHFGYAMAIVVIRA